MVKQYKKLIILIVVLLASPYPTWNGINYYAAGLSDQTQLIEYGMEDDFIYCNKWRPDLYDQKIKISGYKRTEYARLGIFDGRLWPPPTLVIDITPMTTFDWAVKYKYKKILKLDYEPEMIEPDPFHKKLIFLN